MIHFHARQSSLQVLAQTHQALAHPTAHRERISCHVTATAMHDTMALPLDGGSDGNPRKAGGSSSNPAVPHPLRGRATARCGAPGPAECSSSGASTAAVASSVRLTETELSEAQSPQLRSVPERPPPVRGRGGWGTAGTRDERQQQSFQKT
eukprot:Skav228520  [mRNA]  locus=scaffold6629:406:1132:- [translate_table: standard]